MKGLTGVWYSERGFKIEIASKYDGILEGFYHSIEDGAAGIFPLVGLSDTKSFEGSRSFGFVVSWNNEYVNQHSVTSWSGQYTVIDGEEILKTNWLLTRETCAHDRWASTLVGSDTFRRVAPAAAFHPEMETSMQV